jgi:hypothetical protein
MKSDLRNLVTAQEAGEITNASPKGTLTKCGVYVGGCTPPNGAVKTEGTPACY